MDFLLLRRHGFDIEHSPTCAVPGYLIVSPVSPVREAAELSRPARGELAQVLACASEAIKLTIAPVKLHCTHFGEGCAPLRFHLFPRTLPVTHDFLRAFPGQRDLLLHPLLLHWARSRYRAPVQEVWRTVAPFIPALRDAFLLAARARSPLS